MYIKQYINIFTCAASLLSGCACPYPPVWLQSPVFLCVVGPIFAPEPDQNHPLIFGGCKSGLSQPAKLHFLPDVQMYRILPRAILCLMNSFSWGVSKETASMQWRRQMLRASSQSTSRLLVAWCSQLKK